MASPPTFPISTPQSTTTNAASSQSLRSFIRHFSSKLRPWSELIYPNSLSRPVTLSEAYSRVLNNYSFFMPNYLTVIWITLAHSLATNPLYLILFVFLSSWTFLSLFLPSPQTFVLFGRSFSQSIFLGAFVVATVILTDIISLLTSGLTAGLVIVLTHATFQVPDQDLFLHEQEHTNFIPPVSDNSSSSSPPSPTKHDVFISFRGKDSRYGFTSHLCEELRSKNIETYIDGDKLRRGERIWSALQTAIEESMIYVIIFSQNYASSRWCLDELSTILECKEKYGRTVIPVFYHVDPSTVRYQRKSYADDLVKHEKRYKKKVPGWKRALTETASLSGWDLNTIR